jgi:hypothetical protein
VELEPGAVELAAAMHMPSHWYQYFSPFTAALLLLLLLLLQELS